MYVYFVGYLKAIVRSAFFHSKNYLQKIILLFQHFHSELSSSPVDFESALCNI